MDVALSCKIHHLKGLAVFFTAQAIDFHLFMDGDTFFAIDS